MPRSGGKRKTWSAPSRSVTNTPGSGPKANAEATDAPGHPAQRGWGGRAFGAATEGPMSVVPGCSDCGRQGVSSPAWS